MRRVGVLGGSFNPVHVGHLILAQDALEHFGLEKVLLAPCATPPHKDARALAEASHRMAMLKLAASEDARFEVSGLEMDRGGVSYTVDTLSALRKMSPDTRFYFIIGGDTLPELHTWRRIYDLLDMCEVVTMRRPGAPALPLPGDLKLREPWPQRLLEQVFTGHLMDISSTDIRDRVRKGRCIRYFVPFSVEKYILDHELYQTTGAV